MTMFCVSTILTLSCSSLHQTPERPANNLINPEIYLSPPLQSQNLPLKNIQAVLDAPFSQARQAILDVLNQSGYSVQVTPDGDGRIQTLDKQFQGPEYPWVESYSIQITPANDHQTLVRILRRVKIYRTLLLVGPHLWSGRVSNGQREKMFIEQIKQRLTAGAGKNEQ